MNANFLSIIRRIIAEQGEAILTEPRRLKGLISDYAKDEPKAERLAFGRCIEAGAYGELKNAPDAAARQAVKAALARRVNANEAIDIAFCNDALDVLEAALFGEEKPEKALCPACGRELAVDTAVCPFCAAKGAAAPAAAGQAQTASSHGRKNFTMWKLLVAVLMTGVAIICVAGIVFSAQSAAEEERARVEAAAGAMICDIRNHTICITEYLGVDEIIVIPERIANLPVTIIGDHAFFNNNLSSVTIPNSVTSIGDYAFSDNNLSSVTIPNSVTSIGSKAFSYNNLSSVTIPNSVTSIGHGAFFSNNLSSVTIPNSVTSIGDYAFSDNNLSSVTIPNSVTSIGDYAFSDNNLSSVTIPNSVTSIGSKAFSYNNLSSVTIPNSVTNIGVDAFSYNYLSSITIGRGVNIERYSLASIYDEFVKFYNDDAQKSAGTYVYHDSRWRKQ